MAITANDQYWAKFKLLNLKGKKYLQVSDRMIALRELDPTANVITECLQLNLEQRFACFKATITLSDGTVATGHGSETASDFGDYIEKAETKAIGRALTTAGIGIQYAAAQEFDFEGQKKDTARSDYPGVDSPVDVPGSTILLEKGKPKDNALDAFDTVTADDIKHVPEDDAKLEEFYKRELDRIGGAALAAFCEINYRNEDGKPKNRWAMLTKDERIRLMAWAKKQPDKNAKIESELKSA